jgi:hypothetical protein
MLLSSYGIIGKKSIDSRSQILVAIPRLAIRQGRLRFICDEGNKDTKSWNVARGG